MEALWALMHINETGAITLRQSYSDSSPNCQLIQEWSLESESVPESVSRNVNEPKDTMVS